MTQQIAPSPTSAHITQRALFVASDLPALMSVPPAVDPDPRSTPLLQFSLVWNIAPDKAALKADAPVYSGHDPLLLPSVAVIVHALANRDGVPAPAWVLGHRAPADTMLFGWAFDGPYAVGYGNVRPLCAYTIGFGPPTNARQGHPRLVAALGVNDDRYSLLTAERIAELFAAVDTRLAGIRLRFPVQILIVGGAAVAMQWNHRRTTYDVDAVSEDIPVEFWKVVTAVGEQFGLASNWLNAAARVNAPTGPAPGEPSEIYHRPNLRVYGASPHFVLAMKLRAGRDIDLRDMPALLEAVRPRQRDDLYDLVERAYPNVQIPASTQYIIEQVWDDYAAARHAATRAQPSVMFSSGTKFCGGTRPTRATYPVHLLETKCRTLLFQRLLQS